MRNWWVKSFLVDSTKISNSTNVHSICFLLVFKGLKLSTIEFLDLLMKIEF